MALCLLAGANDMGGTLMYESITRSAGASHGQEMAPQHLEALARGAGREPRPRTTLYAEPPAERRRAAMADALPPSRSHAGDLPERLCAAPAAPDR
jgi:FO synthase